MHQGMGLDAFNALPERRAVHALYECCNSVILAHYLVAGRPYDSHDALFRHADELLFSMSDQAIDQIMVAYPDIGRRPRSLRSHAEQCAIWDEDAEVMACLQRASQRYLEQFGFGFVMCCAGLSAREVLATVTDRLYHDRETELKVVRNELARINRTRLERMLGPEGGYLNW